VSNTGPSAKPTRSIHHADQPRQTGFRQLSLFRGHIVAPPVYDLGAIQPQQHQGLLAIARQIGSVEIAGATGAGDQRVEVGTGIGAGWIQRLEHHPVLAALQRKDLIDPLLVVGELRRDLFHATMKLRVPRNRRTPGNVGPHLLTRLCGSGRLILVARIGKFARMAAQFGEALIYVATGGHKGNALDVAAQRIRNTEKSPVANAGNCQKDPQHARKAGDQLRLNRKSRDPACDKMHWLPQVNDARAAVAARATPRTNISSPEVEQIANMTG
jgi:hypothetical protein